MLILTRKRGQSIIIGDNIVVQIVECTGNQVRLGIKAPMDVRVLREEIFLDIMEQNRTAASTSSDSSGEISGDPASEGMRVKPAVAALQGFKSAKGRRLGKSPEVVISKKPKKVD